MKIELLEGYALKDNAGDDELMTTISVTPDHENSIQGVQDYCTI